jgi:transcriptional regulator with XRE-family HTH domain
MNKQDIAQALKEYRDQKGLSLKDLEAEMKMSYATVSNIVNFKLDDVSERMMRTVAAFLKMDDWQLMETNNFAIVHELLWEAQEYSRFFGIVAESGFGKTAALDAYKKKNPNCFYMLSDILMSGRKGFLGTIQRAMGIREGGTPAEMLEAIVVKLNSLKSPLLIIDDAGKLNDSNLRIIQLIYDRTERRCGIVMAGTPYLK